MEKELNQEECEAQLFINETVEEVKGFINGYSTKEVDKDAVSKNVRQQKELASIRAIRGRTNLRERGQDFTREKDNSDRDETEMDYE